MPWVKLAVVNENWAPMQQITVEAYNLAAPDQPIATAVADNQGVALFLNLPSDKKFFFKPRITRASGKAGDQQQAGKTNVQILAYSDVYDAVVDAGGMFGTHTTIQAAIDALAGSTGPVSILVQAGTYTENLTVTSATASYYLVGANPRLVDWPNDTDTAAPVLPLSTIVSGVAGTALDYNTTQPLVIEGIMFLNSAAGNATIRPRGAGKLRLIDCLVQNLAAGGAIRDPAGPLILLIDHCIIAGTLSSDAINIGNNSTCHIENSWCLGRVAADGALGFFLSKSAVQVNNLTQAVVPGKSKGRILGCYIHQAGGGDGVLIVGTGSPIIGWELAGNQIDGGGHAVSANCLNIGAACLVSLSGNIVNGWGIGVAVNATSVVNGAGNTYSDIITLLSGSPTTGRVGLDGIWIAVPFNAADYVASAGTWTVIAGNVGTFAYKIEGNTMTVDLFLIAATVQTTAVAPVYTIKIPNGQVAKRSMDNMCRMTTGGAVVSGIMVVSAGGTTISISETSGTVNWAIAANNGLRGQISFEIV